jgi:hypothetical protein
MINIDNVKFKQIVFVTVVGEILSLPNNVWFIVQHEKATKGIIGYRRVGCIESYIKVGKYWFTESKMTADTYDMAHRIPQPPPPPLARRLPLP